MEYIATVKSQHIPHRNIKVDPTWGLYQNNCSILLHTPTPATPTAPYFPQFPPDYTRNGAEFNMEGQQFYQFWHYRKGTKEEEYSGSSNLSMIQHCEVQNHAVVQI